MLIAAPVHDVLLSKLSALGYTYDIITDVNNERASATVANYEGIITSTRLNMDKAFIDQATQLKWVGRMGSGMEIIDLAYATEKNIVCFSSPEGNANAVAEQALGMLLSLQHKVNSAHAELQQNIWLREENRGVELEGMTAGIIGYGHNGSAFARKLKAIGVNVLALDKYKKGFAEEGIVECAAIQEIYEQADIISFHLPLNNETQFYFDEDFVQSMNKPFVLLNLSRGKIVRQSALYNGMKNGKIIAAALDVFEVEPIQKMKDDMRAQLDELLAMPNFIGTPHIGGYTVQALYKMSFVLAQKIENSIYKN